MISKCYKIFWNEIIEIDLLIVNENIIHAFRYKFQRKKLHSSKRVFKLDVSSCMAT